MNDAGVCPRCGTRLANDVPQGLCPHCLLQQGLDSRPTEQPVPFGAGGFVAPAPAELAPLFPQLEVLELLGQGGMGAVYKARQPGLDRLVALKILPPAAGRDPTFAERFSREARALAKLSHPHIVTVYDFGRAGDFYYFLMEYVDGANLRQVMRTRRLEPREALQIIPQVCTALQYAHEEGVVHRDIKPENILLDTKGRAKIADFGLVKLLGRSPADYTLTDAGQVMGTPHYMAPEQMEKPQTVDHRADIYSLGVVFYEMLTGELPLGRFAPPSQKVRVDVRLDEVVLRALEAQPERRYQHASDIKIDVERISTSAGIMAPVHPGPPMLQPGAAPLLLLCAIFMVVSVLVVTAGVFLVGYAFVAAEPGSNDFWGWMGGAFGCILGGLGSLVGCWNSYRQMSGAGDIMQSPHWTWLDRAFVGYTVMGAVTLLASLGMYVWVSWKSTYPVLMLGGMVVFQGLMFLVIRVFYRRAAQEQLGLRMAPGAVPTALRGPGETPAPAGSVETPAWENWWFRQPRPVQKTLKIALLLVILAGLACFFNFSGSGSAGHGQMRSLVTVGYPDHWYVWRTEENGFSQEIRPSWSLLAGIIGFTALSAGIRIELAEKRRRRAEMAGAATRAV